MAQESSHSLIVDEQSLDRMLTRIAHEIVENNDSIENVALVGIIRRGEVLASRLAEKISDVSQKLAHLISVFIAMILEETPHRCFMQLISILILQAQALCW